MNYGETIDIDSPTFRRLRGGALLNDRRILLQAVRMILQTSPGTYFTDPEYGFSLEDLIMEGVDAAKLARIGARIAGAIEHDDRFESASIAATTVPSGTASKLVFSADVTPVDGETTPLTISIQDLTIDVLLRGG
jgi:phage baseplate assembly protein W